MARTCSIFPLTTLMKSINYTSSLCDHLPKKSSNASAYAMKRLPCISLRKFKRKLLNFLTNSREIRCVLLLLSSARAVRAMACANHSLQSLFSLEEVFCELIIFRYPSMELNLSQVQNELKNVTVR